MLSPLRISHASSQAELEKYAKKKKKKKTDPFAREADDYS